MQIRLNALRRSRLHLCREWKCAKDLILNAFLTNGLECISWQRRAVITTPCKSTRYVRKYQRIYWHSECHDAICTLFLVWKFIYYSGAVYVYIIQTSRKMVCHCAFECTCILKWQDTKKFLLNNSFNITKEFEHVHWLERRFYFVKGKW